MLHCCIPYAEHPEPRAKVRVCTNATGTPTVTVSPSSGSMRLNGPNLGNLRDCLLFKKMY